MCHCTCCSSVPCIILIPCAQDSAQQHVGDCGTQQRKKRSGRAKPLPDQDTEALPDQAMESSSNQSTALGEDNLKKKTAGVRILPDQATELGELHKKSRRSIRPRAVSDQAMMDAVISDSEQEEEEEEGSDAEFVTMSRGSKKVNFQKPCFTNCRPTGYSYFSRLCGNTFTDHLTWHNLHDFFVSDLPSVISGVCGRRGLLP